LRWGSNSRWWILPGPWASSSGAIMCAPELPVNEFVLRC